MNNNNWYFDNITEDIIYGPIDDGNDWICSIRQLKKNSVIRKLARDTSVDVTLLPNVLANAIDAYRIRLGGRK